MTQRIPLGEVLRRNANLAPCVVRLHALWLALVAFGLFFTSIGVVVSVHQLAWPRFVLALGFFLMACLATVSALRRINLTGDRIWLSLAGVTVWEFASDQVEVSAVLQPNGLRRLNFFTPKGRTTFALMRIDLGLSLWSACREMTAPRG